MKYVIQNILTSDCNTILHKHLNYLGIHYHLSDDKTLEIEYTLAPAAEQLLTEQLLRNGIRLIKDKKSMLVESIKFYTLHHIISFELSGFNLSYYLSKELGYNYTYLNNIFSKEQGLSIKQYIIHQKVERVKGMILNDRINLKQIAHLLKYKSVSHLTNQFKKVTGTTPSHFRQKVIVK